MDKRLLIPKHTKCKGCGECCGPVPITEKEFTEINIYVVNNKPKYNKSAGKLQCKFRVDNKCSIYEVRPMMCRLMGVISGMTCKYGNSKNLNGLMFMDLKSKCAGLLNEVVRTKY